MKKQLLSLLSIIFNSVCFAQTDTIFSFNKKIACDIIEITPDAVKYINPGSTLSRSIYKNAIQKVIYKDGQIETFNDLNHIKRVKNALEYRNVSITRVESEVQGLHRIGVVGAKAKGTTRLSRQEKVKNRAYSKLQMFGAMMGANAVFLTNQSTRGNLMVGSAETNLSGVGYTNYLPDITEFMKVVGEGKEFKSDLMVEMSWSQTGLYHETAVRKLSISEVLVENGEIFIFGNLQYEQFIKRFRVVFFDNQSFTIVYENNATVYNWRFKIE